MNAKQRGVRMKKKKNLKESFCCFGHFFLYGSLRRAWYTLFALSITSFTFFPTVLRFEISSGVCFRIVFESDEKLYLSGSNLMRRSVTNFYWIALAIYFNYAYLFLLQILGLKWVLLSNFWFKWINQHNIKSRKWKDIYMGVNLFFLNNFIILFNYASIFRTFINTLLNLKWDF